VITGDSGRRDLNQLQRLSNLGAVGTMTDAQLLEWFISRRDEAAEAAFEELVIQHGPMVPDVCRRVLHDVHDAKDGFQATFLVLAARARSIVRRKSVASWLFGVAYHMSARAGVRAARRRFSEQKIVERTPESDAPGHVDLDLDILHAEVARLPSGCVLQSCCVICKDLRILRRHVNSR
jgi:Sigma-70 region 2